MTRTGTPLTIDLVGGVPELRRPIPRMATMSLPTLTSLTVREFVIVADEDTVEVCGHDFRVRGWQLQPARRLIVEHDCCGSNR